MAKSKEATLEEQLKRLEQIVDALEGQDVPLDDSLMLFEEGVKITRACRDRLEDTQKKIELLVKETGELKPL